MPEGVWELYSSYQAAAQNSARDSKGVNNVGWQQPELRHNLVRCQGGSAQLARNGQGQEECCLHATTAHPIQAHHRRRVV